MSARHITVDYLLDDVVCHDHYEGDTVNAKIYADGRGYVKTPTQSVLYRNVQRITIDKHDGEATP